MLKRFLYSYFALCVIPFLLLGILVSDFSEEKIKEELFNAAEISMAESYRSLNGLVESARETALDVGINQTLQRQLQDISNGTHQSQEDLEELSLWLGEYSKYGNSYMKLGLFLDGTQIEKNQFNSSNVQIVEKGQEEDWYLQALDEPGRFHWSRYQTETSTLLRQAKCIYSAEDWSTLLGVITVDINLERMRSIAMAANTTGNRLYLVDETGVIVYPYYNYDKIPEEILLASENGVYTAGQNLMLVQGVEATGWNLIKSISMAEITQKTKGITKIILTLAVVFAAISVLAAVYFTCQISRPVARLAAKMKGVQTGDLTEIEGGPEKGEIGILYTNFNYMVRRLRTQIEQNYVSRIREKEAELRALQAQINPHFLYNTLDSINWLALRYKADVISKMVLALSDMLRLSLNKGRNTLLVGDELRQVESYIALQKVRYSDSFTVEYEVDPGTKNRRIIKMLLQPIVENAIVHGFEEITEGGLIRIRVKAVPGGTRFEVENNGAQIDMERMRERLEGKDEEENARHGYGIRNVNERIKAFYGSQYGISYEIRNGCTVAAFIIPQEGEMELL